jgi:transmembrane sensor
MSREPTTTPPQAPAHEAGGAPSPTGDGVLDGVLDEERERLKLLFPAPKPKPPLRVARRLGVAAAGALLLAIVGTWWLDPAWRQEQHATAFGERRVIRLRDGSQLTLDSATRLDVSWHLRSRRVALEQGRVRFEVAPSMQPFKVSAQPAFVEVVGTQFDVDRAGGPEGEGTRVAVWHGRVHVWAEGANREPPAVLGKGQQVEVTRTAAGVERGAVSAHLGDEAGSWAQGQLVFQRAPLAQALAQVQRYRKAEIRIEPGAASQLELSGVFDSAQADRLLDLLPRILPVEVVRHPDGSVDVKAR